MTSSNGNIFCVTGPLCGDFTGHGDFPAQKPVTRSFDVFFDPRPKKRFSKQPWSWWFETPSWSLMRHCNEHPPLHRRCSTAAQGWCAWCRMRRNLFERMNSLIINEPTGSPPLSLSLEHHYFNGCDVIFVISFIQNLRVESVGCLLMAHSSRSHSPRCCVAGNAAARSRRSWDTRRESWTI